MVLEEIFSILQNTALLKQPEIVYSILLFASGYFYLFSLRKEKKTKLLQSLTDTDILIISLTFSTLAFVSGFFLTDAFLIFNYPLAFSKIVASELIGIMVLVFLILLQSLHYLKILKDVNKARITLYVNIIIVSVTLFVIPTFSLFCPILKDYLIYDTAISDLGIVFLFLQVILIIQNWFRR